MRSLPGVFAVAATVLLLAGCSTKSSDPPAGDTSSDPTATTKVGTSGAATTSKPATTGATGTSTSSTSVSTTGPGNGEVTTTHRARVLHESFTNSAPSPDPSGADGDCPGAVCHMYAIQMPASATDLKFWYNTTYTGLFHAVASINSPDGDEYSSLDLCPTPPPANGGTDSCEISVPEGVSPGEWTLQLFWQLGEVNETYTFEVSAYGEVPGAA